MKKVIVQAKDEELCFFENEVCCFMCSQDVRDAYSSWQEYLNCSGPVYQEDDSKNPTYSGFLEYFSVSETPMMIILVILPLIVLNAILKTPQKN